MLDWVVGSHTVEAYSRTGRVRVVWLAALTGFVHSLRLRLMKPSVLFPLAATFSTCLFQERSLVSVTPRYLLDSSTARV